MKKYIYIIIFILLLLPILFTQRVTPKNYYHLSKEERLKVIQKLSKKCLVDDDALGLIVTYDEVFHDKNSSHCWSNYYNKCLYNKEHNLTLVLPIKCPIY